MPSMVEILAATKERSADITDLFGANDCIQKCACTWFIQSVATYHSNSVDENMALFEGLLNRGPLAMGLLAYSEGKPIAWCAAGPRSRYIRAIKTPTYKGRNPIEDDTVWLVPCFFVRPDHPKVDIMVEMLTHAVALAKKHGAKAIEGFPFSGSKLRSSGDTQIGIESMFEQCGFSAIRRPSDQRVIMRRELI